jgi:AcrR family transcriptional regulator
MGKAEDTKARIERAALTLFVARGVAETTTKEIAMAASVAEGTIYRYFPSKEQLALDLFLFLHRGLAEALVACHRPVKGSRAKIDAMVRCYCEWADRDWTLFAYHLLTQHLFLAQLADDTPHPLGVIREAIGQAMRSGEIPRRNVELATASALGVVLQAATNKANDRLTGPLLPHARFFADAAWAVLATKER